jgi:FixJ family two-component response regulator
VPLVAVVDDEEPVRKALKRLLRAAGLEAGAYASGLEFLEGAALHPPACLVLDLHMPGMSGQQLLQRMKELGMTLPVVVITAHDTPETHARCLAAGAAAYLRKPLDDRTLLSAISAALGKSIAHGRG